ncbi:tetratricopeptide repeat-containing sensor histidine kinase [Niastella vici]|uniref:tetratricopeptide repeat-containing sensor histidine kinase n=1 Tax=Niastella vici TaxID=1703345 RepID=UPI00118165F9|nr:sensor histidine kinase [Niastella vici]
MLLLCSLSTAHAQDRQQKQDSLRKQLHAHAEDSNKVKLLNSLAASFYQTSADSIIYYAQLAIDLSRQLSFRSGEAEAEAHQAAYYRLKGEYTNAINKLQHGIKVYEELHAIGPAAGNYLEMSQVYKDMGGDNKTLEYINKGIGFSKHAYDLFNSIHDTAGMVESLNQCGIQYRDIAKTNGRKQYYDTAFSVYMKAVDMVERSGKGKKLISKLYNNISQVYNEYLKDYNKALDYLFKAEELNKQSHNLSSLSYNYGNISLAYQKLNQPARALAYSRKMLETSRLLNRPERLRNAYNSMYNAFAATGRFDSALYFYKLADQLDDSLNNVAKTNEVIDLQTKYETGKKESEIRRLHTESLAKNKQIVLLVSALVVFALLAACMMWLYHRIKKQRQEIAAQSNKLEIMMKELHHRVKNNLQIVSSLLSLQTYKVQDEEAVLVLKESQQRVQAMSFIHQRLYKTESLTAVNMKEYLTDLAESLVSSYGFSRDDFDLHITVEKEMLDIDKALPIGLIINELVTNALKYAYDDSKRPFLSIMLTEEETKMVCAIKDNGIGINEQQWKQKKNSFGKQLITALCKQLRAQQAMAIDGGTQFFITIPKQAA